jgi:hypothetical protein
MQRAMLAEALVRWQHAAGPFWPYVCAAPFLETGESVLLAERVPRRGVGATERYSASQRALVDWLLLERKNGRTSARAGVGRSPGGWGEGPGDGRGEGAPGAPVVLADLPPEPLLALGPLLAEQGWYVVPVVQRWIARPAVLPCWELVRRLVHSAWYIRRPANPRGVLLIADGGRLGPPGYPLLAPGRTFDNRYEYQICRFPSARFLQAQGSRRVIWLTGQGLDRPVLGPGGRPEMRTLGIPPVARDLHPYREALLLAGIDVGVTVWESAWRSR